MGSIPINLAKIGKKMDCATLLHLAGYTVIDLSLYFHYNCCVEI